MARTLLLSEAPSERREEVDVVDADSADATSLPNDVYANALIEGHVSEAKLAIAFRALQPNGSLTVRISNPSLIVVDVKLTGFIEIIIANDSLICRKPTWKTGEVATLKSRVSNSTNVATTIWKIPAISADDDDDLVDEDALLAESIISIAAPQPAGCGSEAINGKKRACKDCSCGLAEQEAASSSTVKILTLEEKVAKAGSCGGCAKGDAFRCGGCPFLGMPAFEPGRERVMLSLGAADI